MATTKLTSAVAAIAAQLATDFPTAPAMVNVPFDLEPEVFLGSAANWPDEGEVVFALVDRAVIGEEPARGEQKRINRTDPELQVWMKSSTLAALTALFHSTRRQLFESLDTVERTYKYSSYRWTVQWQAGSAKAGRSNNGFHAVQRVDLLIEFGE